MNMVMPILLVEDNPMDVDLTRRAFSRHNLANPLEVARDGKEALDYSALGTVLADLARAE